MQRSDFKIKTESLIYLTEVARFNSITAAANSLLVTPSAITHSLKLLKDELGGNIDIYKRTGNGIVFTDVGKNLVMIATSILKDLDRMKRIANNENLQEHTCLLPSINDNIILCANLGISTTLSELPLTFHERYPYVNFSIIDLPYNKMLRNINNDAEIFGLAYIIDSHLSDLTRYTNLDYEILHTSNLGIKISKKSNFIADDATSISLKQLSKLPIVLTTYNSSLQNQFLQLLYTYNNELNTPFSVGNIETLLKFVAKDLAVALSASFSSPKEEIDPMPQYNLRLLPVSEHIFAHIVLIFHKNVDSQTLRVLTYHLSQCIGNVFL